MKEDHRGEAVAIVILLIGAALFGLYYLHEGPFAPPSQASGSFKMFLNFPNGTRIEIFPTTSTFSITCGSCGGGGSSISFSPSIAVAFSGDTITGGSCSGTVSFGSVGGVSVASQSVSGTGSVSTSPMVCPMSAATVPFSDFSSLASGTYTLTATLNGEGSVTFTNGGPDSGVGYSISAVSTSVSITVSGGTVTGVSGTIS